MSTGLLDHKEPEGQRKTEMAKKFQIKTNIFDPRAVRPI